MPHVPKWALISLSPWIEPLEFPLPATEFQSPEPSPAGPALASTGPSQAPDGVECQGAPRQQPSSVIGVWRVWMAGRRGDASWEPGSPPTWRGP